PLPGGDLKGAMNNRPQRGYEFGPFRLNTAEHSLLREGQPVPLAPKVFDLLAVLVRNSGHLVEKEELLREVWPESFVEEGNLNRNVSILRKALGEGSAGESYIETVPKRGYRFVAKVKTVTGDGFEPIDSEQLELGSRVKESDVVRADPESKLQPKGTLPGRRWPVLVGLAALVVGTVSYALLHRAARSALKPEIKSLAVLPLQNLSGDPSQEYFADGMTEALISSLAQIRALKVISRTSV